MPLIKITDGDLESKIPSEGKCIVDYYAEWCGPCKMIAPVLDRIANDNITVIKVDIDQYPNLAMNAGVTSVPTLNFYKDGTYTDKLKGAHPEPKIRAKL